MRRWSRVDGRVVGGAQPGKAMCAGRQKRQRSAQGGSSGVRHSADREFAMCLGSHMAIAQLCKTGCLFPHNSKLGCTVRNINDRMTESTALF